MKSLARFAGATVLAAALVGGGLGIAPHLLAAKSAKALADPAHDGARDFDFEIGTWAITGKRLVHPLMNSTEWAPTLGYSHIVQKVWDGQASLAQLANDKPSPHFDGLMLRLYNPAAHQWSIYWGSRSSGTLDTPLIGSFTHGRGEFFHQEIVNGAIVLSRLVYSDITPSSFRTESSSSADGGTTWEVNSVMTFARTKP